MDRSDEKSKYAGNSGTGRRRRNSDKRFAGDYYYNSNHPAWNDRGNEYHQRNFGLPAGERTEPHRHDISERSREYDYNRFGMGDQQGTWNQHRDESYNFGDNNQRHGNPNSDAERARHRGKGPKNFKRSDERVREDINCRLTDDGFVDASEIEVIVENGEVTLTGTVPDRSSKRRAEDISELVSGVTNVENRLRVK